MDHFKDVRIRKFTMDDRDMVVGFFDQMGGETRAFFDRGSANKKNALKLFDGNNENKIDFAALEDDKMVGYVFLWDTDKSIPWLGIAVAEEWKGRKLGRKLISYAIAYCREKEKGGILLTTHLANLRGQGLYSRMGFEYLGTHTTGEMLYLYRFDR